MTEIDRPDSKAADSKNSSIGQWCDDALKHEGFHGLNLGILKLGAQQRSLVAELNLYVADFELSAGCRSGAKANLDLGTAIRGEARAGINITSSGLELGANANGEAAAGALEFTEAARVDVGSRIGISLGAEVTAGKMQLQAEGVASLSHDGFIQFGKIDFYRDRSKEDQFKAQERIKEVF
jgi:hypothetical protein